MLMIEPLLRATIAAPNSWHGSKTPPTRLRSKFARQSAREIFSKGRSAVTVTFESFPPAAFTRMRRAPNVFSIA